MNTRHEASAVAAIYAVLTIVMTWPLSANIAHDVPGDLGDSLLNMWILAWGAESVPRVLTGQMSVREYWDANIFHPEPLALGFSEHLFAQVLQIIPLYWLSDNVILCYNLLFLSSFALSGVGTFLLARDLLREQLADNRPSRDEVILGAAFLAGLIFAFVPYRIAQVAHLQSLHSQWMPLALFGFRRYIVSGRWRALAGGSAALLLQNLSNGYFLMYFSPLVPAVVAHQMWRAGRVRDWRMWSGFVVAAVAVFAGTWPFLALYLELQRAYAFERQLAEVVQYSADVYSYLTAPEALRWWGDTIRAYPKAEGELFFGFVPWLLFFTAAAVVWRRRAATPAHDTDRRVTVKWLLIAIIVVQTLGIIGIVLTGGFVTSVAGMPVRATNALRLILIVSLAVSALVVLSAGARARLIDILKSSLTLWLALAILAMWLSLGPLPQSNGQGLAGIGLYRMLYEYVPGFEGLRVPARYAMIAALFVSIAGAYGAALILRHAGRAAGVTAAALSVVVLGEVWFAPMPVNRTWGSSAIEPPARVLPRADAPPVYHQLANLPDDAVVAEFPFGDVTWELRYVYYSTVHWKPLVNGYSGGFPPGYMKRVALFQRIPENPDAAWRALRDVGTTHVVVHERAFPPGEAAVIVKWLEDHFAVEIARFDGDLLFDVSGVWPPRL